MSMLYHYRSTYTWSCTPSTLWLVGAAWNTTGWFFHSVGNFIVPTDELIFFRKVFFTSIDWFKGKITGKSHDLHGKIYGFRLRFSLFCQPIEKLITHQPTINQPITMMAGLSPNPGARMERTIGTYPSHSLRCARCLPAQVIHGTVVGHLTHPIVNITVHSKPY